MFKANPEQKISNNMAITVANTTVWLLINRLFLGDSKQCISTKHELLGQNGEEQFWVESPTHWANLSGCQCTTKSQHNMT